MLARKLRGRIQTPVVECGDRPEDFTGEIAQAKADTILLVDAVEMGAKAGDVAVFGAGEVRDDACDTHRASLVALMRYLEMRTSATVLLVGIQPGVIADTPDLSPAVAAALDCLEELFVGGCNPEHEDASTKE